MSNFMSKIKEHCQTWVDDYNDYNENNENNVHNDYSLQRSQFWGPMLNFIT